MVEVVEAFRRSLSRVLRGRGPFSVALEAFLVILAGSTAEGQEAKALAC